MKPLAKWKTSEKKIPPQSHSEVRINAALVETVSWGLEPIALIIRFEYEEQGIRFFTPANFSQ